MGFGFGRLMRFRTMALGMIVWSMVGISTPSHAESSDKYPLTQEILKRLSGDLMPETPRLWAGHLNPTKRRWASIESSVPGGGTMVLELPEYMNAYGDHVPPAENVAFFSGRPGIASLHLPEATPEWVEDGDAWVLDVPCGDAVRFTYRVTSSPGRIDVRCDMTNNTGGTLERAIQFLCASVSRDSGFFNTDPRTTHFLYKGKYSDWPLLTDLSLIYQPGTAEDKDVYWLECPVKGSGRVLNPFIRRAVMKDEVDCGVIVQDNTKDPKAKMILIGEPGGSIFKNCRGGCIHTNPSHGTVANGTTDTALVTFLFCETDNVGKVLEDSLREVQ